MNKLFKIMLSTVLIAGAVGVTGCSTKKDEKNTTTKLILRANEKYVVKDEKEVQSKRLVERLNAKDSTLYSDYAFKVDDDVLGTLTNANQLVSGENPLLVTPIAQIVKAESAVSVKKENTDTNENVIKEYTAEETFSKFNTITEISKSSNDINPTLYDEEQQIICYTIGSADGVNLESKYYTVSITIVDDIAPHLIEDADKLIFPCITENNTDIIDATELLMYYTKNASSARAFFENDEITIKYGSYRDPDFLNLYTYEIDDEEEIIHKIIRNRYTDNVLGNELKIIFYTSNLYDIEISDQNNALEYTRQQIKTDGRIIEPCTNIYYRIEDFYGNKSNNGILKLHFDDYEYPNFYLDNEICNYKTMKEDLKNLLNVKKCLTMSIEDTKKIIISYLLENNYLLIDDLNGQLDFNNYISINLENNIFTINAMDYSNNTLTIEIEME